MGNFEKITVDISNICNAKCKWCSTGRKNRQECVQAHFMTKDEFDRVLTYCLEKEIIDRNADVELYSWGEPFLNPDMAEIINIIVEKDMPCILSTNGSRVVDFTENQIKNMKFLMFSLSGFSQTTYGRIHGLRLERVLENIRQMVQPFAKYNMMHKVEINFHVYQFNIGEMKACADFCEALGIRFVPRYAYLADWDLCNGYLCNTMPQDTLKEASKEFFFHYYDGLLGKKPEEYVCPQGKRLFINSEGGVLPCACSTSDVLGNIFEMSYEDIVQGKNTYEKCEKCMETGQAYLIQQYTEFLSEYDQTVEGGIKYYGPKLTPALYYTLGDENFCEEQKMEVSCVLRKDGEFAARFQMNGKMIRQIRFDPCEYPCTLENVAVFCNEEKIGFYPYHAAVCDEKKIVFETNDPCIVSTVNTEVRWIEIRAVIH